ncbi:MAG: hypothetical protein AABW45_02355, partial [Nanoarchaeota archaeon]
MKKEVKLVYLLLLVLIFSLVYSNDVNANGAGCRTNLDCKDGFQCTADVCQKSAGALEGVCVNTDACPDGEVCTSANVCYKEGLAPANNAPSSVKDEWKYYLNSYNKCNSLNDCYFTPNICRYASCLNLRYSQTCTNRDLSTGVCKDWDYLPDQSYCYYPYKSNKDFFGSLLNNLCPGNQLCASYLNTQGTPDYQFGRPTDPENHYPVCKNVCTNECSPSGSTNQCADGITKKICGQNDQDSCLDLVDVQCSGSTPICYNGRCAAKCESNCDTDQCFGNGYKRCVSKTINGVVCKQLQDLELCGSNQACKIDVSGVAQCVIGTPACSNECNPSDPNLNNGRVCSASDKYKSCVKIDKCYKYLEVPCTQGDVCDNGVCVQGSAPPVPSLPTQSFCFGFSSNCGTNNICRDCFSDLGLQFPFGTCAYEFIPKSSSEPVDSRYYDINNKKTICPSDYGYLIEPSCQVSSQDSDSQQCQPSCYYVGFRQESCGDLIDDNCDGILGPSLCNKQMGVCAGTIAACNQFTCTDDDYKKNNANYDGLTELKCEDNLDNDCDGLTDAQDPDCNCLLQSASISQCSGGISLNCEPGESVTMTGNARGTGVICNKINNFQIEARSTSCNI